MKNVKTVGSVNAKAKRHNLSAFPKSSVDRNKLERINMDIANSK